MFPEANIFIDLRKSRLVGIGPDSPEWLKRFQAWGLPPTMVAESGGGEGHRYYYYRRPENCPVFRINRPDEFDIQTDGYLVAPPSFHSSGRFYRWLSGPYYAEDLPDAPTWAVEMLQKRFEERKVQPRPTSSVTPYLRIPIFGKAVPWYTGQKVVLKDSGGIDRSATLFALACKLAEGIATQEAIEDILRERDVALGYSKYTGRRDADLRYAELAARAIQRAHADPRHQRHTRFTNPWTKGVAS